MLRTLSCALVSLSLISAMVAAPSREGSDPAEVEQATRLQIFLDRANFGPGKIDGRYGEFTTKALELYRTSMGGTAGNADSAVPQVPPIAEPPKEVNKASSKKKSAKAPAPDVQGLDLNSIDPVFISYTITEDDAKSVGEAPGEPAAQAKLKWLPYASTAEAIAERFHCDIDFLEELNPGKTKDLKPGDEVKVPNVEPFEFSRDRNDKTSKGSNDEEESKDDKRSDESSKRSVSISTKSNMAEVQEGGKVIAAFPVTVGSQETVSPIGEWKVKKATKLPFFRYDKQMLKHGERSGDFHLLPPGPNNPVGVMWIALNKKGIGIHGTDSPDQIGRNASHGCIRLANWDVVKLAALIGPGTPVKID